MQLSGHRDDDIMVRGATTKIHVQWGLDKAETFCVAAPISHVAILVVCASIITRSAPPVQLARGITAMCRAAVARDILSLSLPAAALL